MLNSKKFLFITVIFSLLFLTFISCGPKLKYKQLKPSRFSLGKEPSFVLGKVAVNPKLDLTKKKKSGFWGGVANVAGNILETWSGSDELKKSLEMIMRSEIANNEFAKYMHNAKYTLDLSGQIEVSDKAERKQEEIKKDGKVVGKKIYYNVTREYELELKYEVIASSDKRLVGASSHTKVKYQTKRGNNALSAAKEFDRWEEVTEDMIERLMPKIMREILPYYINVSRSLRKGKDARIKEAAEVAEKGDLTRAKELWTDLLKVDTLLPEDKAGIYYNIGALYEREDAIEKAREEFKKCLDIDKWCAKGLDRMREREIELKRLKESGL